MSTNANPPTIELREVEPQLFMLVAKIDDQDVVIKDYLDARGSWDFGGTIIDYGFTVAVFQRDSVTFVRIRKATGNRYDDKPDWTTEEWHESTDGGRSWRKRGSPAEGEIVAEFAKGSVNGWSG